MMELQPQTLLPEQKEWKHESNKPGSGLKRPLEAQNQQTFTRDTKKTNHPIKLSDQPPVDPLAEIVQSLPQDFKHTNVIDRSEVLSMLHDEISKHKNYYFPTALPDQLPKTLSTPFQFWLKALARQGVKCGHQKAFLIWTRLKKDQKQGYLDAHQLAIQLYMEFCQGGPSEMAKIKCQAGTLAYQYTKAGQIQKANRVRKSRCRSSKYQRSPADYAAMSHYQSYIRQMRVAISDELEGEKPDFQTCRTLKEIWDKLDEDQRKSFMNENCRDKWKYLAHWEKWLRNRFCQGETPHNVIQKLPERPKTAYKYFYEHQMQLLREEKIEGLEPGTKSYCSRRGFFGQLSREFKLMNTLRRKIYDDAATADELRFKTELQDVIQQVLTYQQQDEVSNEFISDLKGIGIDDNKPKRMKQDKRKKNLMKVSSKGDEEPNGIEDGEDWEHIGSQRQAKYDLLHSLNGDQDYLLTHLSKFIATKRVDAQHQQVEADIASTIINNQPDFNWIDPKKNTKTACLYDGPLNNLNDLLSQEPTTNSSQALPALLPELESKEQEELPLMDRIDKLNMYQQQQNLSAQTWMCPSANLLCPSEHLKPLQKTSKKRAGAGTQQSMMGASYFEETKSIQTRGSNPRETTMDSVNDDGFSAKIDLASIIESQILRDEESDEEVVCLN